MCIDIVEICLEIAHGQISSIFDRVICLRHDNNGVLLINVLLMMSLSHEDVFKACAGSRDPDRHAHSHRAQGLCYLLTEVSHMVK